jgi:hypothetical protein
VGAPGPAHEDRRRVRWLGTDRTAGTEARHDRGGLPEGGSGGGAGKMNGRVLFYSRALRGGNAGLRKEGEREVTAHRGGRAGVLTHAARRSSDVTVAAALRGGYVEGVCLYAIGSGALDRGGTGQSHAACIGVPAHGAYAARG